MMARFTLALVLLAASPAIAETSHETITKRNAKELREHFTGLSHDLELMIRASIRAECLSDPLKLDPETCNRISGMNRLAMEAGRRK